MEPRDKASLSNDKTRAALQYLMCLKQKRNGSIKGRGCADGRKQREHTAQEDASSPTVAIEAVMLTSVIDAKENRDVATVDMHPWRFSAGQHGRCCAYEAAIYEEEV